MVMISSTSTTESASAPSQVGGAKTTPTDLPFHTIQQQSKLVVVAQSFQPREGSEPSEPQGSDDRCIFDRVGGHILRVTSPKEYGQFSISDSINWLELKAIHLALLAIKKDLWFANVLVRMDNMTAKTYVNRQGGTHSRAMMEEASLLFQ